MHPVAQIAEITHGSFAAVAGTQLHFRPGLFVEDASQVEADRSAAGPVLRRQITHERRRVGGREGTVDRLRDTASAEIIERDTRVLASFAYCSRNDSLVTHRAALLPEG